MATYRIRREWPVTMVSWCTVEAESLDEAMSLAMEEDFDDQHIAEGSDGDTIISGAEGDDVETELRSMICRAYRDAGLNAYRCLPGLDDMEVYQLFNHLDLARQGHFKEDRDDG